MACQVEAEAGPQKRARTEGEPRRAKIAVIGSGWWAQGWHLPHLTRHPDSEVAAIVEPCSAPRSTLNPDLKPTKELGEVYGVPVFGAIDELLSSEVAGFLDGVVIASSHSSHYENGIKAMRAGLHVFMEKPMTTDPLEAHALVKAAAASPKVFTVNTTACFREQAKRAAAWVQAGRIGKVQHAQVYMGSPLLWLFDNPENVNWVKPSGNMVGNGFGWGQMCHSLAWIYFVSGLTPESVVCRMSYSEKTGADLYDSAIVTCTSGATISIQGVATLPGKNPVSSKQVDNKLFGTEGFIMYSGDDKEPSSGNLLLRRHDGDSDMVSGFYFENYEAEGNGPESLQGFIGACIGRQFFNAADAENGLKQVQTIDAMYRSAKSGCSEPVVQAPAN